MSAPDWVYPDAQVLLVDMADNEPVAISDVLVRSVAKKSVLVTRRASKSRPERQERVSLDTLRTPRVAGSWRDNHAMIVDPQSERGVELQRLRDRWRLVNRARSAALTWSQDRNNKALLDDAVAAMTELQAALRADGPQL